MKAQRPKRLKNFLTNTFLLALIAALYLMTSGPMAQTVMAQLYGAPVYRGQAANKVALQFAVSWNAAAMERILDVLKASSTRATFAVSGKWAEDNGELLQRMALEGHEIAAMGYEAEKDGKLSWVREDVQKSVSIIEKLAGVKVALYYSGERNVTVSSAAADALRLTHVLCTVDLLCARGSAEDILARALQNPIEGSIMLMQPTSAAADALERLIEAFDKKGIRLTATADVL